MIQSQTWAKVLSKLEFYSPITLGYLPYLVNYFGEDVAMNKNNFTVWELPQDAIARYGWGALCDLAVSADGTSLAAGTGMGVWWYDLTTRLPVTLFETERGMVDCIALCSEQPWLALKNTDKNRNEVIKIWDIQRQKCIAVMEYPARLREDPPQNYVCSLYFSPSGQWLAASRDGSVIVDIYESLTGRLHTSNWNYPLKK